MPYQTPKSNIIDYCIRQLLIGQLKDIDLSEQGLNDADIAPLMQALAKPSNRVAVLQINSINLSGNKLTNLQLPDTLESLKSLSVASNELTNIQLPSTLKSLRFVDLSDNKFPEVNLLKELTEIEALYLLENPKLTDATKIALNAEMALSDYKFVVQLDAPLPNHAVITHDFLDVHFKTILSLSYNDDINYIEQILEQRPSSLFGSDDNHIMKFLETIPGINRARASMDYFKDVFERLSQKDTRSNQLNILNAYNVRFEALIDEAKKYYTGVLKSIDCVIKQRSAVAIVNSDVSQSAAPESLVWSYAASTLPHSTPPGNNGSQVTALRPKAPQPQ